jgi:hypothetical protein
MTSEHMKTITYFAVTNLIVQLYLGLVARLGGFLVRSVDIQNHWGSRKGNMAVAGFRVEPQNICYWR